MSAAAMTREGRHDAPVRKAPHESFRGRLPSVRLARLPIPPLERGEITVVSALMSHARRRVVRYPMGLTTWPAEDDIGWMNQAPASGARYSRLIVATGIFLHGRRRALRGVILGWPRCARTDRTARLWWEHVLG